MAPSAPGADAAREAFILIASVFVSSISIDTALWIAILGGFDAIWGT
jgi:hypothetical protein